MHNNACVVWNGFTTHRHRWSSDMKYKCRNTNRHNSFSVWCYGVCILGWHKARQGKANHFNPFTAEVAIMRLLSSALKSHLCDQKRRSKVTGLSDLMTLFVDLECLYCKQTQRAFNVFKNTLNWMKIHSVDQKFYWLECGNFSQDAGTPGTERVIAFSQLAVKGLMSSTFVRGKCSVLSLSCFGKLLVQKALLLSDINH
jgi:hypothetical protein